MDDKIQFEKYYIAVIEHGLTMEFCLLNSKSILTCQIQIYEHAPLAIPLEMDCCTKPDKIKIQERNYLQNENKNRMD